MRYLSPIFLLLATIQAHAATLNDLSPAKVYPPELFKALAFTPEFAAMGCTSLDISGTPSITDSFSSFSSTIDYAGNGDVASNGSVQISGNSLINGNVVLGPNATVRSVGKSRFGTVERHFAPISCPDIDLPALSYEARAFHNEAAAYLLIPYVQDGILILEDQTLELPEGIYYFQSIALENSSLSFSGPSVVYVEDFISIKSSKVGPFSTDAKFFAAGQINVTGKSEVRGALVGAKDVKIAGASKVAGGVIANNLTITGNSIVLLDVAQKLSRTNIGGTETSFTVNSHFALVELHDRSQLSTVKAELESRGGYLLDVYSNGGFIFRIDTPEAHSWLYSEERSEIAFIGNPLQAANGLPLAVANSLLIVQIDFSIFDPASAPNNAVFVGWLGNNTLAISTGARTIAELLVDVEAISRLQGIIYVSPDFYFSQPEGASHVLPNDYVDPTHAFPTNTPHEYRQDNLWTVKAHPAWQFLYDGLFNGLAVNTALAPSEIGIIDEGIYGPHDELMGVVTQRYQCTITTTADVTFNNCSASTPDSQSYIFNHGTQVASVAGGLTANGKLGASLRWGIPSYDSLVDFKQLGECWTSPECDGHAVGYAAFFNLMVNAHPVRVANISSGADVFGLDVVSSYLAYASHCGGGDGANCSVTYNSSTGTCSVSGTPGKGTLFVLSSGNHYYEETYMDGAVQNRYGDPCDSANPYSREVCYPAKFREKSCFKDRLAVVSNFDDSFQFYPGQGYQKANTLYSTTFTSSSRYRELGSNFGPAVNLTAPGTYVLVADIPRATGDPLYTRATGTSFSAPMVSALAGIVTKLRPNDTVPQILGMMQDSAKQPFSHLEECSFDQRTSTASNNSRCWNQFFGFGMIDAEATVIRSIFEGEPSPLILGMPTKVTVPEDQYYSFTLSIQNHASATGPLWTWIEVPQTISQHAGAWVRSHASGIRADVQYNQRAFALVAPGEEGGLTIQLTGRSAVSNASFNIKLCHNTGFSVNDLLTSGVPDSASDFSPGSCETHTIQVHYLAPCDESVGSGLVCDAIDFVDPIVDDDPSTGPCYTSRALKNTPLEPEIENLRAFRNYSMPKRLHGRKLASKYYETAPEIRWIMDRHHPAKLAYRNVVGRFKTALKAQVYSDISALLVTAQEREALEEPLTTEDANALFELAAEIDDDPIASPELKELIGRGRIFLQGQIGLPKGQVIQNVLNEGL